MRYCDKAHVREEFEKEIWGQVNEWAWNYLDRKYYVDEVRNGDMPMSDLVEEYKDLIAIGKHETTKTEIPSTEIPPDRRDRLVSLIYAKKANDHTVVKWFRKAFLPNGLISKQDIDQWTAKASRDILDSLNGCTNWIASEYHWDEHQAKTFILTGAIPVYSRLTYGIRTTWGADGRHSVKITLEVDPEVPPKTVRSVYHQIRSHVRDGSRYRPLSEKIASLVEFVLTHEDAWEEKFTQWNKKHLEWNYPDIRRFKRDYSRAINALLRAHKDDILPPDISA